ncbi:ATP synthase C chain [Mesoplasma florum W37]|uniref:ATP synthase subunit c n=2 Tax=Mesoplasma florum TaxID=2151 RepID=A0AAD2PSK7_MESFO|nr:ATP synthase F0 subunit C [Mesoplasma florum]AGY41183.1 ATP synthase C chain [Mesoplasma florum W37]AVN59414.1 ATP synthase subunit C [Mesoplasma florum]AVN65521.1 ATP synthase F0 sector subunit c [Mesoplasma florum]
MLFTDYMANFLVGYFSVLSSIMPLLAETSSTGEGLKLLGAGVAIVGVAGAGIGQGAVGQGACMAIGRNPEMAPKITSTMIIAAGIAESGAIYALVVAILLIFVA